MAVTKKNCAAFLTLLFVFLFQYHGITQNYLLSSLPVEKELSSRQITCFFQDSKGFMWIGTEDGLNFYNANSIKFFKHDVKNKNSLLNNFIQNICEDNKGNIWVASANGVDLFDPSKEMSFIIIQKMLKKHHSVSNPKSIQTGKEICGSGAMVCSNLMSSSSQFKRINQSLLRNFKYEICQYDQWFLPG